MPSARSSAVIDAQAASVWGLLADLESWPRWMRVPYATESVAVPTEGPRGAGTEFVMKGRLKSRLFARIVEWVPERRLAFEYTAPSIPATG